MNFKAICLIALFMFTTIETDFICGNEIFLDHTSPFKIIGKNNEYFSLQEAIKASNNGDTILIESMNTRDIDITNPIIINKSIDIICKDKSAIISVGTDNNGIVIIDSDVTIIGITFMFSKTGIVAINSTCEINKCYFEKNTTAIASVSIDSSSIIDIKNSIFKENNIAVKVWSVLGANVSYAMNHCTVDSQIYAACSFSTAFANSYVSLSNSIFSSNRSSLVGNATETIINYCDLWDNYFPINIVTENSIISDNLNIDPEYYADTLRLDTYSSLIDILDNTSTDESYEEISRPQGKGADIGAYEVARITLLQLSDLHLLAPIEGTSYFGESFSSIPWDNVNNTIDSIYENTNQLGGADVIVITGDIVHWASDSLWQYPPFGTPYTDETMNGTYKGYELFKNMLNEKFNDIPIYEIPGNHDYREDPFRPWNWIDKSGVPMPFYLSYNHDEINIVNLNELLSIPIDTDVSLLLLNSGSDALGASNGATDIISTIMSQYAINYVEVMKFLESANNEYTENILGSIAYGSGFSSDQIIQMESIMESSEDGTFIACSHNPIIYPHMTPIQNNAKFIRLCSSGKIPLVLSGHIHQFSQIEVDWNNDFSTTYVTSGATYQGHYNIITLILPSIDNKCKIEITPS